MSRARAVQLAVAAALALLVVAPVAGARTKAQTVRVTMKEFKFTFATTAVHAGKTTFVLLNTGKVAHDLQIAGKTSALVQPGKTGRLVVTLKKGSDPYKCTLPGHAAAGMKGVLKVM